jgi:hypothetical protein
MKGGRKRRPEGKWEKKVEGLIKQKNLTPEEPVNRPIWQKATGNSNRCNNGRLLWLGR